MRCSPGAWLAGAESVLVGAVFYGERYGLKLQPGQGYISPFAWEPDYHTLVLEKLHDLGRYLVQLEPTATFTAQVDSGPGCERIFATLAGVGWQGKNNFIIVPGYGSFVWLGLMTTNIILPYDSPLSSQCGDCERCLHACPTKAYSGPNEFDHSRCMAYWAVDKELTAQQSRIMGQHRIIYGCDYCQLACPYNQVGTSQGKMPSLEEVMIMTVSQFEKLFKSSAAGWRGRNLLRRNAVLACAGNSEFLPMLEELALGQGIVSESARRVLETFQEKG